MLGECTARLCRSALGAGAARSARPRAASGRDALAEALGGEPWTSASACVSPVSDVSRSEELDLLGGDLRPAPVQLEVGDREVDVGVTGRRRQELQADLERRVEPARRAMDHGRDQHQVAGARDVAGRRCSAAASASSVSGSGAAPRRRRWRRRQVHRAARPAVASPAVAASPGRSTVDPLAAASRAPRSAPPARRPGHRWARRRMTRLRTVGVGVDRLHGASAPASAAVASASANRARRAAIAAMSASGSLLVSGSAGAARAPRTFAVANVAASSATPESAVRESACSLHRRAAAACPRPAPRRAQSIREALPAATARARPRGGPPRRPPRIGSGQSRTNARRSKSAAAPDRSPARRARSRGRAGPPRRRATCGGPGRTPRPPRPSDPGDAGRCPGWPSGAPAPARAAPPSRTPRAPPSRSPASAARCPRRSAALYCSNRESVTLASLARRCFGRPPPEVLRRLALRVLRRLARALEAVLLALLHPRVAGQEAGLSESSGSPRRSRAARGRCRGAPRRPGRSRRHPRP